MENPRYLSRGKRIGNGEWVTGFYLHHYEQNKDYIMSGKDKDYQFSIAHPHLVVTGFEWTEINPGTLGQCTGFKNKDVLIFEGDVVEFNFMKKYFTGVVQWKVDEFNGALCLEWLEAESPDDINKPVEYPANALNFWSHSDNFKIIGNIHDLDWEISLSNDDEGDDEA